MSVTTPPGGGLRGLSVRPGLQLLRRRVSTWLLAYLPERSKVRRPAVRIHTAPAVPAAALRTGVALVGLLCASVVVIGTPSWVVVIALLIGLACAPGTMIGGALVITLGLLMMFDPEPPAVWRTPLLIAAVPLMMQLAAIAGQTTWAGRIELQVLAQPMRRYLAVQVFAQLLGLVGVLVAGLGYVLPQVMALGAVSVLALVAFWLPSLGPARRRD
jgi:hypothetical protein